MPNPLALPIKKVSDLIFGRFYGQYLKELEKLVVGTCETLLDVGCGNSSPIKNFSKKLLRTVGVDGFAPSLEKSRRAGIHSEVVCGNVLSIGERFMAKSFDCVVALDVIEHLPKEDGLRLLLMVERIARKRVIIFTPNGFLAQGPGADGNRYQEHLSGWCVSEMRSLGYRVTGINGLKCLRGEYANVNWHPAFFWNKISLLSQPFVYRRPEWAFQILCVKDLG